MPKVTISNAKGLVQSTGSGGLDLEDGTLNPTTMTAGSGITTGTGTVYEASHERLGSGLCRTSILIDITGLRSTAAGDIIGVDGTSLACHIGQITAARSGTIVAGRMTCLEAPDGGDPDINVFAADEGTGAEDAAITTLAETQLVNAGDATAGAVVIFGQGGLGLPAAGQFLYLVAGATTDADYTQGKFLIEFFGTA